MTALVDFVLHFDRHLLELVQAHGPWWIYGLLFAIVFAETGFVVTPFLPGDSLLFAAGALVGPGILQAPPLVGALFLAAFLGNTVNYAIGRMAGPRIFHATDTAGPLHRLLNRDHLARVVPLVNRRVYVQPFVTLQANERRVQQSRQRLGDLGFAHARLTLKVRPTDLRNPVTGDAGPRRLALQGRLRVLGDLKFGMKLQSLFDL